MRADAQDAPPAPAPPAPEPLATPEAAPLPAPTPSSDAPPVSPAAQAAPEPPPPPAAPAPAPAEHYEGQVSATSEPGAAEAEPDYGDDSDDTDNDAATDADDGKFELPAFSIRLDPFNWLLDGRFGLELEVAIFDAITVELVPSFVANDSPPTIDFDSLDQDITQHSNGLGALAGTSLGVGFWLDGKAFEGYVLRAIFTNYGYTFEASDSAGKFDLVNRTERRLMGFIGSYMRWGFFTIGGGLGLGYELNQQERCDLNVATTAGGDDVIRGVSNGCDGELQLAADRGANSYADINGFLHPVYLEGRFSLGIVID